MSFTSGASMANITVVHIIMLNNLIAGGLRGHRYRVDIIVMAADQTNSGRIRIHQISRL